MCHAGGTVPAICETLIEDSNKAPMLVEPQVKEKKANVDLLKTVSTCHHDAITDLLCCDAPGEGPILLSASRDGLIKVWR
jgi:hypothetical protein